MMPVSGVIVLGLTQKPKALGRVINMWVNSALLVSFTGSYGT